MRTSAHQHVHTSAQTNEYKGIKRSIQADVGGGTDTGILPDL